MVWPSLCGWHVVGEYGIVLSNSFWSLPKFMDQFKVLSIRDPEWTISLPDDSLLPIFRESLMLTNCDYITLDGLLTIILAKPSLVYNANIPIPWSIERLYLPFFPWALHINIRNLAVWCPYLNLLPIPEVQWSRGLYWGSVGSHLNGLSLTLSHVTTR